MDSPEVRQLSLSLFTEIKPICVHISQLALQNLDTKTGSDLISSLRELNERLQNHRDIHKCDYVLSAKLADYIFFPLSNLLKHSNLDQEVVRYIFDTITFLIKYSWKNNIDENFLDQLCPVLIFLSGGPAILSQKTPEITKKDFPFKASAVACIVQITRCFPRLYLTNDTNIKRLSVLGDCTTLLLDTMCSFLSPLNQEENTVVLEILDLLQWLYSTRVTAEQTSLVFPGIVSKIVNFSVSTRNLHADTICKVLTTLSTVIVKVFDDKDLNVQICDDSVTSENLQTLQDLTTEERVTELKVIPIRIDMKRSLESPQHRNELWLRATSKQLKLSLLSLFKYLLFNLSMKTKVAVNVQVSDAIFEFVKHVTGKCFHSLFAEVVQSGFDILSALIYDITSHSPEIPEDPFLKQTLDIYLRFDYTSLKLLVKQLHIKTDDLVFKQFPSVLALLNEEKIGVCISAIKVHFYVLQSLGDITNMGQDALVLLKERVINTLISQMGKQDYSGKNLKATRDELLKLLSGDTRPNTMDNIELPPHINANSLTKLKKDEKPVNTVQGASDLRRLASEWNQDFQSNDFALFSKVYSKAIEETFKGLLSFIGRQSPKQIELFVSMISETSHTKHEDDGFILGQSVSLWTSNQIFRSFKSDTFEIDEFLDLDDAMDDSDETGYIILEQALDLISQTKRMVSEGSVAPSVSQSGVYHIAYAVALETVEILASKLTKHDFQADFLMDHLFTLLEALTFPSDTVAHLQARKTLDAIVNNYYNDSLGNLILDNADYLIDSLSMSLSVESALTPSLPGILLVVLKIAGVQLLQENQLNDILSEIFIIIDSYHGYLVLVENFFLVFEVIVEITSELYRDVLSDKNKVEHPESRYKPWGMTTKEQMIKMIDDNERLVEMYEGFDLSKEYFQRQPGVPFEEQADSDDEDEEPPPVENTWNCPIPKNTYGLIQQIFTYGLQLLSHPSEKLKVQVLRTLQKAYPLMSTNYTLLMPLLAQYWPMILVLTSGSSTISEYDPSNNPQLIEPALRLTMQIIEEDNRHEAFMSRRFIDMWDFWKRKSQVFGGVKSTKSSKHVSTITVSKHTVSPVVEQLYVLTLITGLNTYEKIVPDLTAIEMAEACVTLGIPKNSHPNRDVQALLWVVRHN